MAGSIVAEHLLPVVILKGSEHLLHHEGAVKAFGYIDAHPLGQKRKLLVGEHGQFFGVHGPIVKNVP